MLTLNAGSSSIKFALFDADSLARLIDGAVDGLGATPHFKADFRIENAAVAPPHAHDIGDHHDALAAILGFVRRVDSDRPIVAVGHRIVHGGIDRREPTLLNESVYAALESLTPLAPLHQPHNLAGVRAALQTFPNAVQVACFDTGFHRAHSFVADAFALPRALYDEGIRRYGFHGLSYESILTRLRHEMPAHAGGRVIIAHLGNGASMCAVKDARPVASSMGFSALDGLPMGTRCGQLDPGVVLYLLQHKRMGADAIADLLYRESGLRGLSGVSHDMRALLASDSGQAKEAIDYFVFRAQREIGALAAALQGLDTLVFTGGIGEHAAPVRAAIVEGMAWLGLRLDTQANEKNATRISAEGARVSIFVLRSDEEQTIAEHTCAVWQARG
jgi:acetate kinase